VRTGTGASARIAFAPGTALNLGAETDVTVRRLDRGPAGNLIAELSLASGVIAGPTLPADAPAARVEVETPAALIVSRRVGPRIEVGPDGATHVSAPGDAPAGSISVEGKDALVTEITLGPGEQTDVTVGAAPTAANVAPTLTVTPSAPASPAGPDAASAAPPPTGTPGTGRPATATPAPVPGPAAPAASPAPGAAPGAAGVGAGALAAPLAAPAPLQGPAGPWGPVSPFPPPGLAGLAATTSTLPCAVAPGQICTGTLKGAGQSGVGGTFTGVVQGSQIWRVDVTGADPQGGAMVYIQTTLGFESIPCPVPTPAPTSTTSRPTSSNAALVCAGSTMG